MSIDKKTPIFILEGNIGAGKSTFLKIIGSALNAQIVYEPVEKWQNISGENILQQFYTEMPRWAYSFQTYAFVTRVVSQRENALNNKTPLQILERSVFSDRYCFAKNCYEMGKMSNMEWQLYREWFDWLVANYTPTPDAFIYLQTDPEVCYNRLQARNRSEETGVSLDYLKLLHEKHENWLIHKQDLLPYISKVPVITLPCNEDFEHNVDNQKKHIDKIFEFLIKIAPENYANFSKSNEYQHTV